MSDQGYRIKFPEEIDQKLLADCKKKSLLPPQVIKMIVSEHYYKKDEGI